MARTRHCRVERVSWNKGPEKRCYYYRRNWETSLKGSYLSNQNSCLLAKPGMKLEQVGRALWESEGFVGAQSVQSWRDSVTEKRLVRAR